MIKQYCLGWCLTARACRVLSPVGLAVSSSVDGTPMLLRLSAHQPKACLLQATLLPSPPYHLLQVEETEMSVRQSMQLIILSYRLSPATRRMSGAHAVILYERECELVL